mgnify:CR=1 FL=1
MKKLLMVLAVVCIPQVVTADTPSYVEGKRAIEIIEQGTIIEMRLERLTSEFLKKFTVLFKGDGYQCGVKIFNNDSIASRCLKLKLEDFKW